MQLFPGNSSQQKEALNYRTHRNTFNYGKNTIISLLSRLAGKGYLATNKIGRRNKYTALVSEKEYQETQTTAFIDRIYKGNVQGLVSTLIQKELISEEDYKELRKYWEGGDKS